MPPARSLSKKTFKAASAAHAKLARCSHSADILWEANNLMLWILYVTSHHLRDEEGPLLCSDGVSNVVLQLDPNGELSNRWREKFLAFALDGNVAELPGEVARWVGHCFRSANLSDDMERGIETMATRYALFLHVQSDVRLTPVSGTLHGFALYTRIARRKNDVIAFVTGHISRDAPSGAQAREYNADRPRNGQPLCRLLGPIRFAWAGCTPNCRIVIDTGRYPRGAVLRVLRDVAPGGQLVVDQMPMYLGERVFETQCIHEVFSDVV